MDKANGYPCYLGLARQNIASIHESLYSVCMEPLSTLQTGLSMTNAGVSLGKAATGGIRAVHQQLRRAAIADPRWINIDKNGGVKEAFTADEIRDIERFLQSERVRPILSLTAIGRLSTATLANDERQEFAETVERSFKDEAKRWSIDSKYKWIDRAGAIWDRITAILDVTMPRQLVDLQDELSLYAQFLSSPLTSRGNSKVKRQYLTQLSALAQDIEHLVRSSDAADHLAELQATASKVPMIGHTDVDTKADFRDLYVPRRISGTHGARRGMVADDVLLSDNPYRVVVMGPPGAGKSTLINHLATSRRNPDSATLTAPMIVLRCREYFTTNWGKSITEYAAARISTDFSVSITDEDLTRMLTLGRLIIVFDGLDEISSRSERANMVQRIQALTAQYPPVSILVTTREVGYESAPLDSDLFFHVRLDEFSFPEVQLYCQKWFDSVAKGELASHFLRESESVNDLRKNPLLLSLLCILYIGSGAIPADRRNIYLKCADLFFHKWDQQRHIPQDDFLPVHADRLMQQIASKFSSVRGTQSAMEEYKIVQVVSQYMRDRLAFQFEQAEQAARDFLRFCTTRAWLLRDVGSNPSGIRMLEFVHQTFYEFFAAESFAGNAESDEHVADRILQVYNQNPTSVFPDLLLQSYEWRREGHGSNVIELLCAPRTPSELLLRLMHAPALTPQAIDATFNLAIARWGVDGEGLTGPDFSALIQMGSVPRMRFVEEYLFQPERLSLRRLFMKDWANLQLTGTGSGNQVTWERLKLNADNFQAWQPVVDRLVENFKQELLAMTEPSVVNYMLRLGFAPAPPISPWHYLTHGGPYGWSSGYVWFCIKKLLSEGITWPENAREPIRKLHAQLTSGLAIPGYVLIHVVESLDAIYAEDKVLLPSSDDESIKMAGQVLAIILLSLAEMDNYNLGLVAQADALFPGRLSDVAHLRNENMLSNFESSLLPNDSAAACLAYLPSVCTDWTIGRANFVDVAHSQGQDQNLLEG